MKNRPGSRISLIFRRISTFNDFVSGIAQNRIRSFELFTGSDEGVSGTAIFVCWRSIAIL